MNTEEKSNIYVGEVDINLLKIASENPRKTIDVKHVEKLAELINKNGFDNTFALKAYEADGLYYVFAGGNRLAACKSLGMDTVPMFLYEGYSTEEIWRMAYDDNEQAGTQKQLSVVDKWMDYREKSAKGMNQQQIAKALRVSQQSVGFSIQLSYLPQNILEYFTTSDSLNERHGRELLSLLPGSKLYQNIPSVWYSKAGFLEEIIEKAFTKSNPTATDFRKHVDSYNKTIASYNEAIASIPEANHVQFDEELNKAKARTSSAVARVKSKVMAEIEEAEQRRLDDIRAQLDEAEAAKVKAEREAKRLERVETVLSKIIHGDAIESISQVTDKIKTVIIDPPYGVDFQSNRRTASVKLDKIASDASMKDATNLLSRYLWAIKGVLAEDAHLFIWCNWECERHFMHVIEAAGFVIKSGIIWKKPNHGTGDLECAFAKKHERIIHAIQGRPKLITRLPDVLDGQVKLDSEHPTPKPIDLMQRIIEATTHEDEVVMDGFCGIGSTAVSAVNAGRTFWGSELEKKYHTEAVQNVYELINE